MTSAYRAREVAVRCFATEFNDATHSFTTSDETTATQYTLLPTGQRVNRVFLVGTLTRTYDTSSDDSEAYLKATVSDSTGEFTVYAGEYQAPERDFLQRTDPPAYVSVIGKPRVWTGDNQNGDETEATVTIEPEEIVGSDTVIRDEWVRETAEHTLNRIDALQADATPDSDRTRNVYDTDPQSYVSPVIDALTNAATETEREVPPTQ